VIDDAILLSKLDGIFFYLTSDNQATA